MYLEGTFKQQQHSGWENGGGALRGLIPTPLCREVMHAEKEKKVTFAMCLSVLDHSMGH